MASLSSLANSLTGGIVGQATSSLTSLVSSAGGSSTSWLTRGRALPDPALSIDWDINMPFSLNSAYVEEVNVPLLMNINPSAPIKRGPFYIFNAESIDVPTVNMTFYEDRKFTVTTWAKNWQNQIYNFQTGAMGMPGKSNSTNGYKRIITMTPKDSTQTTIGTIYLIGIWPTHVDPVTFNSDSTQRIQLRINFQLERVAVVAASNSILSSALTTLKNTATNTLTSAVTGKISGVSSKITKALSIG